MSICSLLCANYRVMVGLLGWISYQRHCLGTSISGLYCVNYHIAVGLLGVNSMPKGLFRHVY